MTDLPIEDVIEDVRRALADAGIGILTAPPGSGKTTVVPIRLLDEPWRGDHKIVVLEPRRIATRAAAHRIAQLMGETVGDRVGYVTRDDRRTSNRTVIEVVTEGVLTRRLQSNPELPGTAAVLFDEVHERNLQTDLGLALTLDVRTSLRPDLRVLLMSATIDADRLAARIAGHPVPVVTGDARTYPIDVRWMPQGRRTGIEVGVSNAVRQALDTIDGDVLVFLPGMGEIVTSKRRLEDDGVYADIHILHGSLPPDDQDRAISPSRTGKPKVVLSTDIAETSLTVEGVKTVVDSGFARAPRFDARTGMTRLITVPISKASAEQRAGRAGRLGPGLAFRLWSKLEHAGRPGDIEPEILKIELAGFMLELAAWGTVDPADLTFIDPPPSRAVEEAVDLLERLGAIESGRITESGREMSRLPLHPRLARMVADSGIDQPLACVLAALVDGRDLFSGRPDDVPTDLVERVRIVSGGASDRRVDRRRIDRMQRTANDLMRRASVPPLPVDPDRSGSVLALAFPDRLSIRRGSRGRFQMRTGTTAWMRPEDSLAGEQFLIAVDLDGKRKDARIRLAAPLDADDVATLFSDDVTVERDLVWRGDRVTQRTRRRLGGLTLDEVERRPDPGPAVAAALVERVARDELRPLSWTRKASALTERVAFLHRAIGEPWPDWSPSGLVEHLHEWLAPSLGYASGMDDVAAIDLLQLFRGRLPHRLHAELDRLAPEAYRLPSGRTVPLDYSTGETPTLSVRAQELFGVRSHPTVGGLPLVVEVLSPANRPIQVTSDLPGFWSGSWAEVRKQMAGRYPKHSWPEDPGSA
ncbi:MAG: ATP-dependent helicase HrpB [Acidimicrobiia bacterium]|nr:ATP-dependent helicase HrpB [Acidimicrobiia bacterium]